MIVQKRVADYVRDNGIKNSFIVERTGYSKLKVSRILNLHQHMSADEFEQFCKALRKSPNDFIEYEEN